jgi:hypothetical protein
MKSFLCLSLLVISSAVLADGFDVTKEVESARISAEKVAVTYSADMRPIYTSGADKTVVTYLRHGLGARASISHLIFSDLSGRTFGVSKLSAEKAAELEAHAQALATMTLDTRTLAEVKTAVRESDRLANLSATEQVRSISEWLSGGQSMQSGERKSFGGGQLRCQIDCDYVRDLAIDRCDTGNSTGESVCNLLPLIPQVACLRNIYLETQRCKERARGEWRNCSIRCTFETIPN